ncbi:hypothetical protein [Psychrobacter sp. AOP31-A1-22]|uniref:hypothetical protein n=1 Tax=Psychrobacter sp. AOP31-A1-22 TaxID=3457696 RepID=UPI00403636DB
MSKEYNNLIKKWVKAKNAKSITFSFNGDNMAEASITALFHEQIIKRTLARLACCVGNGSVQAREDISGYAKLAQLIQPIYNDALGVQYEYGPMTEEESALVSQLPTQVFSRWLVLMLERDVLPNAGKLENVFITRDF